MPERVPFVHKFLKRLNHWDKDAVQNMVVTLAEESDLYEVILSEIHEGAIVVNEQGFVRMINRQAETWLAPKAKVTAKTHLEDVCSDTALLRFLEDHLPDLKMKTVQDFHLLFPRELHLRVFLIPLEGIPKKQTLILLFNITEQRTRETEGERLARIETMIRLAAGLAHEIGNPLNSLTIHLDLLKKEAKSLPPAKRDSFSKTIAILNSETSRLDKIVRNFLKATRRPPLRFQTENLNTVVEEALRFMEPELKEKEISVQFRPDSGLAPFLLDRERLYQSFINLIKNASEAMPQGGNLNVRISHKEQVAFIRFQDSGQGIPEKDLPHIFEAYYTTKEEGSGLGLMIVYNAIVEHSGRIEVTSKMGKGTTFTLLLPIRRTRLQLPNPVRESKPL